MLETEWVLFTSGSTGTPKPVVHTLKSLAGHLIGRPPPVGDQTCLVHVLRCASLWRTANSAARIIGRRIAGTVQPGRAASRFSGARGGGRRVTHILGTPSHWRRALLTPAHKLISPGVCAPVRRSGEPGDPRSAQNRLSATLRWCMPSPLPRPAWASRSADGHAGISRLPAARRHALRAWNLRVTDGTLRLRSTRIAKQLLGRADAGGRRCTAGFVDTGDEVVLDRATGIFLPDGSDGVINVGGQKVHPEEVEAVINQHPAVQMSRVDPRAAIPITWCRRRCRNRHAARLMPVLHRRQRQDDRSLETQVN